MKTLNEQELKAINAGGGAISLDGVRDIGQMANNAWKDLKSGYQGQ